MLFDNTTKVEVKNKTNSAKSKNNRSNRKIKITFSLFFSFLIFIFAKNENMLELIVYLTPVYVTLFWLIILNIKGRHSTEPKLFLGKFMIFAFVVYVSHLFFFCTSLAIYPYLDPLYQLSSLMVYPMYFVYIRLLTVDKQFNIQKHYIHFIAPVFLAILYTIGVLLVDFSEFKQWQYYREFTNASPVLVYLHVVHWIIRFTFVCQVLSYIYMSLKILDTHAEKAGQFYSDIADSGVRSVKMISVSMFLTGICSILVAILGRDFFLLSPYLAILPSGVFGSLIFIIGYLGMLQKPVNPTFETVLEKDFKEVESMNQNSNGLLMKLLDVFENQKIYLNENLNIIHLANILGTNRTYISQAINHHFQQNFCSFVNSYRIAELKRMLKENPHHTNQILADQCGFSSVDSLKRAVKSQTGLTVSELKELQQKQPNVS